MMAKHGRNPVTPPGQCLTKSLNYMTKSDFTFLCNQAMVAPEVALENKFVRQVLKEDKEANNVANQIKLVAVLSTQF